MAGRPIGSKNRVNVVAREAFQLAFDKLGGYHGLAKWAENNLSDFYKLYSRLIPVEMSGSIELREAADLTNEELKGIIAASRGRVIEAAESHRELN